MGLGWGWAFGLSNPNTVRSWMDPATALGLGAGKLVGGLGLGDRTHLLLTLFRGSAFFLAALIGLRLLWRSRGGISSMRAIGLTMLAVVVLGPVVQPWYLAWGIVLLAPVADGRLRATLVWLSVAVSFLALPDARQLVLELGLANPLIVAVTCAGLVGVLGVPTVPRLRRGIASFVDDRRAGTGSGADVKPDTISGPATTAASSAPLAPSPAPPPGRELSPSP
ncbi:MAG: polyprenol phosphomannose-dependent alpha 1,6 mannosyltransferase MptB [Acidimicrobiales bacterium]